MKSEECCVAGERECTKCCSSRGHIYWRGYIRVAVQYMVRAIRVRFGGAILERGFWLYVWRVRCRKHVFYYVGRTGDSSSRYAASPFSRVGQHLDIRPRATANMLLRHIRSRRLDARQCSYELLAVGPLFPEQSNLVDHRRHRDIVAP